MFIRFSIALLAISAAVAQQSEIQQRSQEDRQKMLDLLQITSLRQGANGTDPKASNYANYDESKANPYSNLPDPLVLKNGKKVTAAEVWWNQRRPEIVEDFDREIYGRVPKITPRVTWEVIKITDETNGGEAVKTRLLLGHVDNSTHPQITVDIQLALTTPAKATGPVPVILELGFAPGFGGRPGGPSGTSPPPGPTWQQQVLAKGWGYAELVPASIQADNGAGLTQGIIGLVNKGEPRKPEDWGALRAWAWGASRALDYFETDKAVDAKRVGIEGHSRYGKATLVAMAYDPRFAVAFVSSSGEGGAKLHRRNWGELVENLAAPNEYHWMAGNFLKYSGPLNWNDLPVDSHELIALCAPRPVFLSAGATQGDGWVDAKGSFLAAAGAGPVYKLLGKRDMGTSVFPPIETGLMDGAVAFRQHAGGHTPGPNWPTFIAFADNAFSTTQAAAGSPDLLTAIRNGDRPRVQKLLRAGANVNAADSDGTTALMHAVIESDLDMLRLMVNRGANVNAKNALDSTALMYAATNLAKVRLLLDAGADVKVKGKRGATPMSVAVTTFGSTPVLKLLKAKGAEPDDRLMTAAAQRGDLEAMRYLLEIGVNPAGVDSATTLSGALGSRCEACVRLLVEKGVRADGTGGANGQGGVLSQTAKRAMPEMSQLMLDHGASLEAKDRDGFTLLMQAVLSMEGAAKRDAMVEWLLAKGADPNAKSDRGETAWQLAGRLGTISTQNLLVKAGAREVKDDWPHPSGVSTAEAALTKAIPLIEMSGEAVFRNRACVSCHNNSLPAMTVALARQKGFAVNESQAKKELGFAVATDQPFFEPMRLGSTIGGGADTLGYTLMGMAAAGYPADALTDVHIHYLSIVQSPDGAWRPGSYRPPSEYSPFTTTALVLRAVRLYPIPGRRAEFEERVVHARRWLLANRASSAEEQSMQLNGLASAGASGSERAPFVKALKSAQNEDGSWSQIPGIRGDAYATGEVLYALHLSGGVPAGDSAYQKGVQWLLRNQLADGSWFVPTRATPLQPHFESGFPHGPSQFSSAGGSSWASMALLFTLPDRPAANRKDN